MYNREHAPTAKLLKLGGEALILDKLYFGLVILCRVKRRENVVHPEGTEIAAVFSRWKQHLCDYFDCPCIVWQNVMYHAKVAQMLGHWVGDKK